MNLTERDCSSFEGTIHTGRSSSCTGLLFDHEKGLGPRRTKVVITKSTKQSENWHRERSFTSELVVTFKLQWEIKELAGIHLFYVKGPLNLRKQGGN